jgi:hypothetical protein
MNTDLIKVRNTDTGQVLEVVLLSKSVEVIVIGSGVHTMKCELKPTRTRSAYAGSIMGREIVYERTPEQVKADIDKANPNLREYRR